MSSEFVQSWVLSPTDSFVVNQSQPAPHAYGASVVDALHGYVDETIANSPYANYDKEQVSSLLAAERLYARETTDRSAEIMGRLMELEALPIPLRETLGDTHLEAADLFRALGAMKLGEPVVPDATVINVFEWHYARMSVRQQRFEAREALLLKARYIEQVASAVSTGQLPSAALEHTVQRFNTMRLLLDDGYDTDVVNAIGTASMDVDGMHQVVLGPRTDQHTVTHEFTHVAAGEDEAMVEQNPCNRSDYSGLDRIFNGSALGRLLNEAVVDHIASSLENGHFDITDVTHESRANVEYRLGEKLLDEFNKAGVPIRLFINAYYENNSDRDSLGGLSATAALINALKSTYPRRDVIAEVSSGTSRGRKSENKELGEKYLKTLRREARLTKCRNVLAKLAMLGQNQ